MKHIHLISALFSSAITGWIINNHVVELGDVTITHFPWSDITKQTGTDPKDVMARADASGNQTFACPKGAGPNRLDCPHAIDEWMLMMDDEGFIDIDAEACTSITKACCQAVVCAPGHPAVHVRPDEVTGRMWSPLTIKCINAGKGGVWYDGNANVYVQMLLPRGDRCAA